jgi:hypothetical protein
MELNLFSFLFKLTKNKRRKNAREKGTLDRDCIHQEISEQPEKGQDRERKVDTWGLTPFASFRHESDEHSPRPTQTPLGVG